MYRRVSSSSIAEVGYNPSTSTLAIRFHNGREYWYADVPSATLEALLSASSIGAFFQAEIRDSYPFQRIR
jgi:lysyl-tRNA synthetase class 2